MAERHLYLIRHGHYDHAGSNGKAGGAPKQGAGGPGLSGTGREQARLTAEALRDEPINAVHCSTLRRAAETAGILPAPFPNVRVRRARDLRECLPSVPTAFVQRKNPELGLVEVQNRLHTDAGFAGEMERRFLEVAGYKPGAVGRGRAQCDRAFARYFMPVARSNRHEFLVCHGNILQYLLCCVHTKPGAGAPRSALGQEPCSWYKAGL